MPNGDEQRLSHYVVIDPNLILLRCFDRAAPWQERRRETIEAALVLPTFDLELSLAALYRGAEPVAPPLGGCETG